MDIDSKALGNFGAGCRGLRNEGAASTRNAAGARQREGEQQDQRIKATKHFHSAIRALGAHSNQEGLVQVHLGNGFELQFALSESPD